MKLLFIKGDNVWNVRMAKYFDYFSHRGDRVRFWGWDREDRNPQYKGVLTTYLLSGGGFGGRKLLFYYPLWMLKLFIKALLFRKEEDELIIAVNFDAALPLYLSSIFKSRRYVYEIHDEFALSYKLPSLVKKAIQRIDRAIMRKAYFVIHVDNNRVKDNLSTNIVIENSPIDVISQDSRDYSDLEHTFAVIGNISSSRGISSIAEFASSNPNVKILLVGKFYNAELKKSLLEIKNIEYRDYMPQKELFMLLKKCCAIFSLYDPSLEINRLAASNKVYDAMMLGVPVITNSEVVNSKFIADSEVGLVVSYQYDETWSVLSDPRFINRAVKLGKNGRKLYIEEYRFDKLIENRLLPLLQNYETNHTRP